MSEYAVRQELDLGLLKQVPDHAGLKRELYLTEALPSGNRLTEQKAPQRRQSTDNAAVLFYQYHYLFSRCMIDRPS